MNVAVKTHQAEVRSARNQHGEEGSVGNENYETRSGEKQYVDMWTSTRRGLRLRAFLVRGLVWIGFRLSRSGLKFVCSLCYTHSSICVAAWLYDAPSRY